MPSVFIKTYGCASSQNDSEIIAGLLKSTGFEIISEINSDIVVIVSCSVKNVTENKILSYVDVLLKQDRKILVTGCLADANPDAFDSRISLLGTKRINEISETCNEILKGKIVRKLKGEHENRKRKPCFVSRKSDYKTNEVRPEKGCKRILDNGPGYFQLWWRKKSA
ncbi:MAG: hypothetical protein J4473_03730 [Candidatus Aenigmarchaeota archaeon]|nr:hypothetical protein [Candidatus Aenigmarchaeota archaeon]